MKRKIFLLFHCASKMRNDLLVPEQYDNDHWCETLEIYNLNIRMCKLPCKHKTESGTILMSDENQDKK
jgi:hypothetical protein